MCKIMVFSLQTRKAAALFVFLGLFRRHLATAYQHPLRDMSRYGSCRGIRNSNRNGCFGGEIWSKRPGCSSFSVKSTVMLGSPVELWDSYLHALDTAPLLTKSVTAGVIFPAADATAQLLDRRGNVEADSGSWDIFRTIRWLTFGFFVQAPWNHFFYVLLDGALPPTPDPLSTTTGLKVVIDQFVQAPVFTVVIFAVLGFMEGKNVEDISMQLGKDYKSTMVANWGVFVPAAVVNLAFCPPQLRVLFLNVVFFCWTIFLSGVLNRGDLVEEER
ncbi:unnamed protein product [Choristocarpus tenellus]